MRIFITGANGFIGGAVAATLIKQGHTVRGLVRDRAKADLVAAYGVDAVIGSLDDAALLQAEAAHRPTPSSMRPAAIIAARSRP